MNYRHSFHAGNFADVLKHTVLTRVLAHLCLKGTPFRVIDTHGGAGLYDLAGDEAGRTGEWRDGVGRLDIAELPPDCEETLKSYRAAVHAARALHGPTIYPGSPWIIQHMLRREDRLITSELHPRTHKSLVDVLGKDVRCKALALDGWLALRANVPPKERRGLVLIDPPFELTDEFETFARELVAAHTKWPTGTYIGWYPLKDRAAADLFLNRLVGAGILRILRLELSVDRSERAGGLSATGLVIINPPWTLAGDMEGLLKQLSRTLAQGQNPGYRCDMLAGES